METTIESATVTEQEIAAAVRRATDEVFSTMLGIEISGGEMDTAQTAGCTQSGVVALLGLAGDWIGSGSVSCSPEFACRMASQLLMSEYGAVNEDVLDAVAEVANMIVGNVKTHLEEKLGPMGLSTPTVIYGRNFQTRSTRNQEWTVVPFDCEGERLYVQVCLVPNQDQGQKTTRAGFPVPHVLNV